MGIEREPDRPVREAESTVPEDQLGQKTIQDFGDQWNEFSENDGFYASQDLLADILGPLLSTSEFSSTRVADIGSGTGRIVRMLLDAGASSVVAVEPSQGIEALRANLADVADRTSILHTTGDQLPADLSLDFVVSIGVIQFIPDPLPTLRAARAALKPGGRLLIWVYAQEGSGWYRSLLQPFRLVAGRLPESALLSFCGMLNLGLDPYIALCRIFPLPLRSYILNVLAKLDRRTRKLVIHDQLRPSYVKFYRRDELEHLMKSAGFESVQCHHRRGYSWTVLAENPEGPEGRI